MLPHPNRPNTLYFGVHDDANVYTQGPDGVYNVYSDDEVRGRGQGKGLSILLRKSFRTLLHSEF